MERYRSEYRTTLFLLIGTIMAILFYTPALGQDIRQVTINYIEVAPSQEQWGNNVRAYVTVSSADQEPVQGLANSYFSILEDGNQMTDFRTTQTSEPMSLVLAIDTSGSMLAQDKSGKTSMEVAKKAAIEFISMLGVGDRVALFSFNNDTNFHLDFTPDREVVNKAINSLSSKYMAATCLYDTAMEAVKKASEIPKGRRAVILFTDGKDEKGNGPCSLYTSNDVIDAATTKAIRVPVYTIGAGPQVDARELGRLASLTGGRSMIASSMSELSSFYRVLANQIKNQYLVEFLSRSPSGEHSLIIKIEYNENLEQDEKRFWSPPLPVMQPPEISILNPGQNNDVRGIVDIRFKITPETGITKIRYFIDSVLKEEDRTPPFIDFQWDTTGFSEGLHIIRVEAVHSNGLIGTAERTVNLLPVEDKTIESETPPIEEKEEGTSFYLWIIIAAILIVFLVMVLFVKRKLQKEGKGRVTTTPRLETRLREPKKEEIEKPKAYQLDDNEATTIDAQTALDPIAKITVLKSQSLDLGATFKVVGTTEIGRGTDNSIRIPDKSVSRKHAVINYSGGKFYIRDLKSTYGTRVDGEEVTASGVVLEDGSQIQLGTDTMLEFNILVFKKNEEDDDKTKIYGQD